MAEHEEYAAKLIASGYRATSNKYKMVSRLDRADWRDYMARKHAPWDIDEGYKWIGAMGSYAIEFYHRVYSRDTIERLPSDVFALIKKAPMPTDYLELVE